MQTKSGNDLFPIGIGTWLIGGTYEYDAAEKYEGSKAHYDNEVAEIEAIRYSIEKGQNHIDCAEAYGAFHTDEVIGRAIAGLNREDLFIADKLWKTSVGEGQVRPTVELMLQKLGTSYLDMLYIHWPWQEVDWLQAIPQIDELIDEGIVRNFGVSNFTIEDMKLAQKSTKHSIAANQMNYNLLHQNEVTAEMKDYCTSNNIQIVAYQPVKRQEVMNNEYIKVVAEKYNISPAQVALAWLLSQNILTIPKTIQKAHIDENVAAVNITLTNEDIQLLNKFLS